MFCPECGTEFKQGAKFCQRCGKRMASRTGTGGWSMIVGGIILVVAGVFFTQAAGDSIQQARILGMFWQGESLGTLYFYQAAGVGAIVLGVVVGIFGIRKLI